MIRRPRLAFALDTADLDRALPFLDRLVGRVDVVKVGLELFVTEGPPAVRAARHRGFDVFLDLKLHDIPETVGRAVSSAGATGASLLTIHASGGRRMLARAQRAAGAVRLLAVTALTSLDDDALGEIGIADRAAAWTERLAALAIGEGVTGLVASPLEAAALRARFGPDVLLVTPGIRSASDPAGDQARTATASEAVRAGSDLLVVGRPIRDAPDPAAAAMRIRDEMDAA